MHVGSFSWVLAQALMVLIPMLLSLTVHEYAHARVARALGDDTAERAGRLTLNPVAHADPLGTVLLPLAILMLNGAMAGSLPFFGWARPTPINAGRFTRRITVRVGSMLVAGAGPLANIVLAALCAGFLALAQRSGQAALAAPALSQLALMMLSVNVALCIFNLLPLHPLDGATIVGGLLSPGRAVAFERFGQRYGTWILWGIILFGREFVTLPVAAVARGLLGAAGVA